MFTVEESLIADYEKILTGELPKITISYFDNLSQAQKETYAVIIIRYALKNLLKLTPEQALYMVDEELLTNLKLNQFLRYINFPYNLPNDSWFYIVFLCYPNHFMDKREKLVLYVYKRALTKEQRLPSNFFEGEEGKELTAIAFNYQLNFLGMNIDELYHAFADKNRGKKILASLKLAAAVGSCFRTPLELLHYSLPDKLKRNLWYNYYKFKEEYKQRTKELKGGGE